VPSTLTGGFAVCLVVAALGVPLGYTHMAELGLNTAVGPRTLAIYLSPLIILFCAGARFIRVHAGAPALASPPRGRPPGSSCPAAAD